MKSVIKSNEINHVKTYPYLAIFKDGDFVVLFSSKDRGTIVWTNIPNSHPIGDFSSSWKETDFSPFDGEVIFSND